MKQYRQIIWLGTLVIVVLPTLVQAHTTATGLATLTVEGSRLTYRLTLVLSELPDEPARRIASAVDGNTSDLEYVVTALRQSLRMQADNRLCQPGRAVLQGSRLGDNRVILELGLHCSGTPESLVIHDDWFDLFGTHYQTLMRIETPSGIQQVAMLPDARDATIHLGGARSGPPTSFVWLGVEHILTGYDHLLFLAGLLLCGGRIVALAKIVTAFTVAHSITLAIAVLGLVALPDRLVEVVIAASITWIALENLVRRAVPARRWVAAFVFGLVHGFGFASVLRTLALPSWNLALALVGFNLGVEIGQSLVMIVVLPFLLWIRRSVWETRFVRTMSLALAIVGAIWCVQRLLAI